jgi:hypothetical protein
MSGRCISKVEPADLLDNADSPVLGRDWSLADLRSVIMSTAASRRMSAALAPIRIRPTRRLGGFNQFA